MPPPVSRWTCCCSPQLLLPPDLVDVDGGEEILEHGGHEGEVPALPAQVAHDEERMLLELPRLHVVALQR